MLLWFGKKTRVQLVPGGKVKKGRCPECGHAARFREVEVTRTLTAYSLIDLSDDKERLFRCSECAELFELKAEPTPARDARAEAKLAAMRARKAELEAALLKKQQLMEKRRRKAAVQSELEKLKGKMGL